MARTPSMSPSEALDAAQRALGNNRPHGVIDAANRGAIRSWLVAEGIPSSFVQTLSLPTLRGVWEDTGNGTLAAMRAMAKNAPQDTQDAQDGEPQELPLSPPRTKSDKPADAEKASKMLADALAAISALNGGPKAELDEGRVIELVKQHAPKLEHALVRVEVRKADGQEIHLDPAPRHEAFEEILGAIADGENVLIVGPAGSGKTHLAEQVAHALGTSFAFTGAIASEYKLLGFKNAQGEYVPTSYRQTYEHGGLYLWDEMDASSAQALLPFNAGLANDHQDFPDAVVARHKDFRCIASANTYGNGADRQYVGRNQLDAASLDRFYVVPMDYDERLERTIFGDNEWTTYCQKARKAVRSLNLRHVVSMRAIASGHRAIARNEDRQKFERAVLWKHLSDADIQKIKAAM